MTQPLFALEITDNSLKLLEGFENEGQVYVIYTTERPLVDIIDNGHIVDRNRLVEEIKAITTINDPDAKLNVRVSEVILILPPYGLEVFENEKLTTIVSSEGRIDNIDIRNLYALILNQQLPSENNSVFVDVIPDCFIIDHTRRYATPPIGQISSNLAVQAKIHTLPGPLVESYRNVVLEAGVAVNRYVVAPFAACEALSKQEEIPDSYFLIDIGAEITTISLIGEKKLYASSFFAWGGNCLTRHIASAFNISYEKAEEIKCRYGYDKKQMSFPIPVATNEEGMTFTLTQLNELVKEELDVFINHLNTTIEILLTGYEDDCRSLPMVLIGGGALLNGIASYLSPRVASSSIQVAVPMALGARKPGLYNLLGAILVQSKYKSINEDVHPTIVPASSQAVNNTNNSVTGATHNPFSSLFKGGN